MTAKLFRSGLLVVEQPSGAMNDYREGCLLHSTQPLLERQTKRVSIGFKPLGTCLTEVTVGEEGGEIDLRLMFANLSPDLATGEQEIFLYQPSLGYTWPFRQGRWSESFMTTFCRRELEGNYGLSGCFVLTDCLVAA